MQSLGSYFPKNPIITTSLYKFKCTPKNFTKIIQPTKCFCSKAVDVNTNVIKDVIIYKFVNNRFFKFLNIFAISQFGFWAYLSNFAYTGLRDAPVDKSKEVAWWNRINLGENKYRNGISLICFIIGFGILSISWIYTLRSVKYLILHKGGKEVTIVTYAPFGENRMFKLGLENISCKETRQLAKSQLPIKVRGHSFHYIVDMKGEFKNPTLFDHTVGLRRTLKKI